MQVFSLGTTLRRLLEGAATHMPSCEQLACGLSGAKVHLLVTHLVVLVVVELAA